MPGRGGDRRFDNQRRARLVPSGQVVKVFILTPVLIFERWRFVREEDCYAAVQLVCEGDAARVVDGGGLAVKRVCGERG